jgi:hypothetical protein
MRLETHASKNACVWKRMRLETHASLDVYMNPIFPDTIFSSYERTRTPTVPSGHWLASLLVQHASNHSHCQCKLKYLFFLFFFRKIGKLEHSKLHRNFTYDPKIPMGH